MAADTSALEPGTVIADRYRVVNKIGHGGMGAVYVVEHVHTDETLALKVLHPQILRDESAVERFRREARAPARITSEHVARVTDADTAANLDGAPFYVMELLRGRDLERILREDGPIRAELVVEYLRQAARALDKAHAIGIVHRDLKPENLFLTEREDGTPRIKLLDFGIARIGESGTTQPDGKLTTQVGYVIGTPNYMAPEQTMGNPELVGAATDVRALGLLAFKLLVGHEFFQGTTTPALYAEILATPIPTPTDCGSTYGPGFDAWFAGCVARDTGKRYASAGAAVARLAEALSVTITSRVSSASFPDLPRIVHTPSEPMIPVGPLSTGSAPDEAPPAPPEPPIATMDPAPVADRRAAGRLAVMIGAVAVLLVGGVVAALVLVRTPSQGLVATPASAAPSSALSTTLPVDAPPLDPEPSATSAALAPLESARPRTSVAGTPATKTAGTSTGGAHKASPKEGNSLSSAQRRRLDALQRLCSQGTYSPAECTAKREAIVHGGS